MVRTLSEVKSNKATGILKIAAIIIMVIDHVGAVFLPQYHNLRIIGRLAFPLFAYCIAVGCVATRNIGKYALRVLLMALIVQPLYVTAMRHQQMLAFDWAHNFYRVDLIVQHYYLTSHHVIHFSLFLGILAIWTIRDKKYILTALVLAVCWYVQRYIDYGMYGIYLMLIFYAFLDRPEVSAVWVGAYMIWYGLPGRMQLTLFPMLENQSVSTQFWAILALPLIYIPMDVKFRFNKWVYYLLYPAHLIAFYLIRLIWKI